MHRQTDREDNNFRIDHEEGTPASGLDVSVFVTKKPTMTGLRFRLKISNPEDHNEELAHDAVSSEPSSGKALNGYKKVHSVSNGEELKHSERTEETATHNVILQNCGSSESKELDDGMGSKPPTCQECGKIFRSMKSLYGHLRSHPERDYRGANRPSRDSNPPGGDSPSDQARTVPNWSVRAKRGRKLVVEVVGTEMITAAQNLMLLKGPIPRNEKETDLLRDEKSNSMRIEKDEDDIEAELPKKKIKALESIAKSSPAVKTGGYTCNICNKSFPTHQALGGHMASHNKTRNNSEAEKVEVIEENCIIRDAEGVDLNCVVAKAPAAEHRCKTCNETFSSGQALGGHMRKHWLGPVNRTGPSAVPSAESLRSANHVLIDLDLNEPPKSEEEIEL